MARKRVGVEQGLHHDGQGINRLAHVYRMLADPCAGVGTHQHRQPRGSGAQ
jgi:hypothetical protein